MIRPDNIELEDHTADFRCDKHGGAVTALNLNTNTEYNEDSSLIIIKGSELAPPCGCVTCFPTENGNQDAQDIAAAKTE